MQDESYDHGHVHFIPQNTVFFDVRTRGGRRCRHEEGFSRNNSIQKLYYIVTTMYNSIVVYSSNSSMTT